MDMLKPTTPRTDQLNADCLIGRTLTIRINKVTVIDSKEQPVTVHYDGDEGRPWKPCKSMCRVLAQLWGNESKNYVGKSLTLYCDPNVAFGGVKVGGIRISHMSDIGEKAVLQLTATKGKRTPFTVQPLAVNAGPTLADLLHELETAVSLDELKTLFASASKLAKGDDDKARVIAAKDKRKTELTTN